MSATRTAAPATAPSTAPDAPWDGGDPYSDALHRGRGPLWLRRADGGRHPLDVARWCGPPDAADDTLVRRALRAGGPVLDIGCGPGRLTAAVVRRGRPALGVDITRAAVLRTRRLGAAALHRSVFDRIPGEGRWGAALLADGNLGIGGDPAALLVRCAELLAPGGELLVEVEPGRVDECVTVQVEDGLGRLGPPFRWARLGEAAAVGRARAAGLCADGAWTAGGRRFLVLRGCGGRGRA